MNKQELIKEFREVGIYSLNIFGTEIKAIPTEIAITSIEQLDEPKPVKIPQFMADWINHSRNIGCSLFGAMSRFEEKIENKKWMQWAENQELFAQAWIFGYEVEEEKRYLVKVKGMSEENTYLTFRFGHTWMLSNFEECEEFRLHHTRKELKKAGFGWVFNCEGIEIKEVEG